MKTAPLTGWSASAAISRCCARISQVFRLRIPPRRPVAQKSQASAHPTCELRQTMYFAVGSACEPGGLTGPAPLLEGARVGRVRQRDPHRLDGVTVGGPKQVLHESVGGLSPFDDLEVGPFAAALQGRGRGVREATHRPGRKPGGAEAMHAGEHPLAELAAHAVRRERLAHFAAVEIAEIQHVGRRN